MSAPPPPPQQHAPPAVGHPGDLTKAVANVEELKARISSKEPGRPWHQPLFNPFQDPVRCLLGYCCGPCMYGMTQAEVDGSGDWIVPCLIFYLSSMFCLQWYIGQPTRSKIRQKYGLEEAPQSDCITYTALCCFAICQESAEIEFQKKSGNAGKPAPPVGGGAPPPAPVSQAPPSQQM